MMFGVKAAKLLVMLHMSVSALTASPPEPPLSLSNHLNLNLTLSHNSSVVSTPNFLPVDHYNCSIPSLVGNKQVTFYNYGGFLNRQGLLEVIQSAYNDACVRHHAFDRINTYPLLYVQRRLGTRVALAFFPDPTTTWGEWAETVVCLEHFSQQWDNVELNFLLNVIGDGKILGLGRLEHV